MKTVIQRYLMTKQIRTKCFAAIAGVLLSSQTSQAATSVLPSFEYDGNGGIFGSSLVNLGAFSTLTTDEFGAKVNCMQPLQDSDSQQEVENFVQEIRQLAEENPFACELSIEILTKLANEEDAEAQWMLGLCYLLGIGVEESEFLGGFWISRSAMNGDPVGILLIAMMMIS